jgi:hypothetical protein
VQLDLDFDKRFGSERVGAYERLLLDVIDGRLNLFVRSDEQEEAWRWVEPVLDAWKRSAGPRALRRRHLGPERLQRDDRARRLLLGEKTEMLDGSRLRCPRWRRPNSAWPSWCWPTRAPSPTCRWASWPTAPMSASPPWCASAAASATTACRFQAQAGGQRQRRRALHPPQRGRADDKTGDIMVKVIDNTVAAFLKYRNDASTFAIERRRRPGGHLPAGKRIEFFGVGNSGIVAQDAQHKFFRLGVNTIAYSDGHMQVMSASLLGPGDCVVVISNSGRTRDLMDACDIARRNGATTIVITATGSPLASRPHPPVGRPPRGLRPLQPDGVAPAAPADHRHPGHLRGAAHRWRHGAAAAAGDEEQPAQQAVHLTGLSPRQT